SSVSPQDFFNLFRFVVDAKAIDDGGAGVVEPHHLHLGPFAAELEHHLVEGAHGGNVPEVGAGQVDHHVVQGLAEIKLAGKALGGVEEHLAHHPVGAGGAGAVQIGGDVHEVADLVGEEQGRQQHTGQHAKRQVVGGHHHGHRHQHDQVGGQGVFLEVED